VSLTLFLLSLLAGWLVNLAADTLPVRCSVLQTWYWPLCPMMRLLPPRLRRAGVCAQDQEHTGRYLAAWVLAVLLGWLAEWRTGGRPEGFILAGQAWFFLAIAIIDLEHRRVLNRMLAAAAPLILLSNWAIGMPAISMALAGALAGLVLFALLAFAAPGSMGMGDAKLAGVIGLTLGLTDLWFALLISVWAGGLASLVILIRHRFRRGQTMAYAPYLVLGTWSALYLGADRWRVLLERSA
jgi:prepilin signal peptidase PulO-like enzyme (type II secretory pathway)